MVNNVPGEVKPSQEFEQCGNIYANNPIFDLENVDGGAALNYLCPRDLSKFTISGEYKFT